MNIDNVNSILSRIPLLLSILDRRKFSPTYGCFDRDHWHYLLAADFPSGIYQQGVFTLSILYKNNFPGNIYFNNPVILEYITAGMVYWAKIQNSDGSFNEWFPNEHSFVATAFSSYAISQAYLSLKDNLSEVDLNKRNVILNALGKAGRWLSENEDRFLANHVAGAVASLYNIYLITNDDYFLKAKDKKIDKILEFQSEEGWLYEYGGPDMGYLSVSIDYLARYYKISKDPRLRSCLEKALDFLVYFIHPDGSCGGEYSSRNIKYLMPHGLRILASEFNTASYIIDKLYLGIRNQVLPFFNTVDDRYLIFFFLPSFLGAEFESAEKVPPLDPGTKYCKIFKKSGLVSLKTEQYHFICNANKNGVLKIFSTKDTQGLVYSDSGYIVDFGKRKACSQYLFDSRAEVSLREDDLLIIGISGCFIYITGRIKFSKCLFLFRLFNYTLGRSNKIMDIFNRWIKKRLILRKNRAPFSLERKITVDKARITIDDIIKKDKSVWCRDLWAENNADIQYSPSSRYFIASDLKMRKENMNLADPLNNDGEVKLRSEIVFLDGNIEFTRGPL